MSEDPVENRFPIRDRYDLVYRYKTHMKWMINAKGMMKNAMPKTFNEKMKWI